MTTVPYHCPCNQADDDLDWQVIKPELFAIIMDFFASGLPVLTDEQPQSLDTGMCKQDLLVWRVCLTCSEICMWYMCVCMPS